MIWCPLRAPQERQHGGEEGLWSFFGDVVPAVGDDHGAPAVAGQRRADRVLRLLLRTVHSAPLFSPRNISFIDGEKQALGVSSGVELFQPTHVGETALRWRSEHTRR